MTLRKASIALGTAIAEGFNALTLLLILRGRVGGLDGRRLAVAAIKISIAAAIMETASMVRSAAVGERPRTSSTTSRTAAITAISPSSNNTSTRSALLRREPPTPRSFRRAAATSPRPAHRGTGGQIHSSCEVRGQGEPRPYEELTPLRPACQPASRSVRALLARL